MAQEKTSVTACQSHEADLVLLHYGDLQETERERLSRHVAECAGCAGYLKELALLLPLTAKSDDPPREFWTDYSRELRGKIDDAVEKSAWWGNLRTFFTPRYLTAFASAAVIAAALTFTLGKGYWSGNPQLTDDEIAEMLPVAENLEFFSAMDILDDWELLELISGPGDKAA